MVVSILAIKFNHDTNAATHDALNIRIDASGTINVPKWTGGETLASQSTAAYAIEAVGANSITVQARFRTDNVVRFLCTLRSCACRTLRRLTSAIIILGLIMCLRAAVAAEAAPPSGGTRGRRTFRGY